MNLSPMHDDTPLRDLSLADAAAAIIECGLALRTRGALSSSARRALRETSAAQLDAICARISRDAEGDSAVDDCARLEAARSGVLRASLMLDLPPGSLPALRALDEALARRALAASQEAPAGVEIERSPPRESPDHLAAVAERLPDFAPPGEALDAFLSRGTHAAWVRSWADASVDVACRLDALFEEAEATGTPLSLRAWQWRRSWSPSTAPIPLDVPLLLAADDGAERPVVRDLGLLDPVAAVGRVVARGARVELRVIPLEDAAVRALNFGELRVARADDEGIWTAEIAWRPDPVVLRVEGSDGSVFEETLCFTRDPPP